MGRDEGRVKGDSLWPNMVVSTADNCWPVHMHSGMGGHSERQLLACAHALWDRGLQ